MLNLDAYQGDLGKLIDAAKAVGVEHILCVGVDLPTTPAVIAVAEKFNHVSASVGVHPSEKIVHELSVEELVALASHPKVVAIGETGLDYYYNKTGWDEMGERFRRHIRAAIELNKPLIIHSRSAQQDTIRILTEENAKQVRGVMHCFTESWEMAQQAMDLGFYISFSGIVSFKNAKNVITVAEKVPLERMLIETDAPYLAPEPHRGKSNEPKYLPFVAEQIAKLKQVPIEIIAQHTRENYIALFGKI
jgi:TatD DNase family protein